MGNNIGYMVSSESFVNEQTRVMDEIPPWTDYWQNYGTRLLLFARQYSYDSTDAEDIVQDAFIRFWRSKNWQNVSSENIVSTLFRYVRYSALDYLRKNKRRRNREEQAVRKCIEQISMFENSLELLERQRLIEQAIQGLSADQRQVLALKIWGDLTFIHIGEILDVSPNTAASRYRYALKNLKNQLEGRI